MKDYRFWNHSVNPITGFVVRNEQLDSEVTRINALHLKRQSEDTQIDLEDMIKEVKQLETFKNN